MIIIIVITVADDGGEDYYSHFSYPRCYHYHYYHRYISVVVVVLFGGVTFVCSSLHDAAGMEVSQTFLRIKRPGGARHYGNGGISRQSVKIDCHRENRAPRGVVTAHRNATGARHGPSLLSITNRQAANGGEFIWGA